MMSILLVFAALASDPSTYGRTATLALPPTGAVRVSLPPDLVGGAPESLSTGLLLTDATGRAVPHAVLLSSRSGEAESVSLYTVPVGDAEWTIAASSAPIDALSLEVSNLEAGGPFRAEVRWPGGAAETLLWALASDAVRVVAVPHVVGPFSLTLSGWGGVRPRLSDVVGLRDAPDHVPPNVESFALPEPVVTEAGAARYVLRLPGTRTVRAVRFELPDAVDVFARDVTVRVLGAGVYAYENAYGPIRRLRLGAANVDRLEVPAPGLVGDTVVLEVPLERGAPLPFTKVHVVSEGAMLVARDAGPGPHTLLGAGTVPDTAYDLAVALPELLRADPPLVALEASAPNPGFVPPPTREGVDGAGPDLGLGRFAYERPIVGEGWVRLRLGRDVLARARPDLADVRVVDAVGRQLPFLLYETGEADPWPVPAVERTERGASSLLRVPLDGDAPVASVRLTTSRGVFDRQVTLLRDAGRFTVPVRTVRWSGPEQGSTLAIDVGERLGGALLVRIDNGDDAPLPVEGVAVATAGWDLRVRVPADGARLVYGAPGARAPDYDLELLRAEIIRMPVREATLGEERPLAAPAASLVDRAAAFAGVGMLVVGLLGMVFRTLRGVRADAAP